jgi:large subunit ribosomal protein L18
MIMPSKQKQKKARAERRKKRVRRKIFGIPEKPRLCVYKSLNQIYVQLVNDRDGRTLTGVSSLTPAVKAQIKPEDTKSAVSKKVGVFLAAKAKEMGISTVVFDRNRYPYHGRVKSLAEGAREGGIGF